MINKDLILSLKSQSLTMIQGLEQDFYENRRSFSKLPWRLPYSRYSRVRI